MKEPSADIVESLRSTYLSVLFEALDGLKDEPLREAVALLERAREERALVLVFGNGGSAATAAHMACDLAKNAGATGTPRLRAIAIADAPATLTAYANDLSYERTFAEPLLTFGSAGDVAIAISASGESPNVVAAFEAARVVGMSTLALTGPGGSTVARLADVCIHGGGDSPEQIEDVHLVVNHLLTVMLRASATPASHQ